MHRLYTSPPALRATPTASYGGGIPIVFVSADRLLPAVPTLDQLRAHFALTTSEARVALLLAGRRSNDQIARALGISTHTARHHTEKVFLKLHVHRRMDVLDRLVPLFVV